jgi:hypothetical protein
MAAFRCTGCERDLKPHCPDRMETSPQSHCDWWTCSNRACDHETYDVKRGVLRYTDLHVERLGA